MDGNQYSEISRYNPPIVIDLHRKLVEIEVTEKIIIVYYRLENG